MAAILTGDLVRSVEGAPRAIDFSIGALSAGADEIAHWGAGRTRFTRFRGDGWQIHLSSDGLALRAALFLAACLRTAETGLRTRVGCGVGAVERLDDDLGRSAGPAFVRSGRALDRMPRGRWLLIDGLGPAPWAGAAVELADWIAARWSREQAEAVSLALDPSGPSQGEIAARLGVTRQAVQARLSGAGFQALAGTLAAFEAAS
jgi:hypothetical protein